MVEMSQVRAMVVLLDGASFDVFASLAKEGTLPNFRKLMEEGCFNVLYSTIPAVTPVAIPSLVSGKGPGKHGMFGFGHDENGIIVPHTSTSIQVETLWTKLHGRVILLNVPWTYPPPKVNGIVISGFPSPGNKIESHPPDFISSLKSKIGEYYLDIPCLRRVRQYKGLEEKKFLKEAYLVTKKRAEAVYYLMENHDWDFFLTVFTSLDRIQHTLFGHFDKESPFYNQEKREVLIKYYKEIDKIVGNIISRLDKNTILMLVSDHGFEPLYKYVGVNDLLVQGGFREIRLRLLAKEIIVGLLNKMGLRDIIRRISIEVIGESERKFPSKIDFSSKIYSFLAGSIFINKEKLEKGETYESVRRKLVDFFYSVKDEETGKKIVEKIFYKNEIYHGNYINRAPDLTIVFKKGYEPRLWVKGVIQPVSQIENRLSKTGTHAGLSAQRGILLVSGKGIRKGKKKHFLNKAKIIDIAPTIMHILGTPIPKDTDGHVLKEIFAPNSRFAKEPVKYQEISFKKEDKVFRLSKDEEEDIKERLRSLGYID